MTADNAFASPVPGEFLKLFLIIADKIDGGLDLCFNRFTERKLRFAAEDAVLVIETIDAKKSAISDGAEEGEPAVICGDDIEAVAVDDEIFPVWRLVNVLGGHV